MGWVALHSKENQYFIPLDLVANDWQIAGINSTQGDDFTYFLLRCALFDALAFSVFQDQYDHR